jgi:choline dehydrogenase-like flavoprotein
MAFVDAQALAPGATLDADVCIVGAGPAGLAVALDLARTGLRVLLLESGGFDVEPATDELNAIESTGAPLRTERLRDRRFGGTAWYGRAVAMDAIDFAARAWVAPDGWPIGVREVETWYPPAAAFLGLERPEALRREWWPHSAAAAALTGGGIVPVPHLIAHDKDLGRRHRSAVASAAALTAVTHATVVRIDAADGGASVAALRVAGRAGGAFTATARRYVLACGGLENARSLLLLADDCPGIFGASEGALGRGYMNHPRTEDVARLYLDPREPRFIEFYRTLTERPSRPARCTVLFAAALDPDVQHRERLLNASAFCYAVSKPRLAGLRGDLDALRDHLSRGRLDRGDPGRALRLAADLPLLAGAAAARVRGRPYCLDHLAIVDQLEQAPDAESRLQLGEGRDRFGRRKLRVVWRIGADTRRTHARFHALLAERLRETRAGVLRSRLLTEPDYEPAYEDNAHPMGATRMSSDPRRGVVNTDGRVHALENLYVAGSSVFPAGGQANPTLTIVALALRLAAYLRNTSGRLGASVQTSDAERGDVIRSAAEGTSPQMAARSSGEMKR